MNRFEAVVFLRFVMAVFFRQLRETRKAVRDSEAGLEKMAIGRHINDRGHVITRQRNTQTGDLDENRDYLNMAEGE